MLAKAMKRQFSNAFDVLQAAIPSFSPKQWRRGKPPFDGPARATAHVLQCAEFFTCDERDVFVNLGKKVWQMADKDLPSQRKMTEYLKAVRKKSLRWISTLSRTGLDKPWHNKQAINGLDRIAYALRHLQHHTGEICAYQKQLGIEPAQWK